MSGKQGSLLTRRTRVFDRLKTKPANILYLFLFGVHIRVSWVLLSSVSLYPFAAVWRRDPVGMLGLNTRRKDLVSFSLPFVFLSMSFPV